MPTQRTLFQLANIAGFTDPPDSLLAAGNNFYAWLLMALQADADFGVCTPELFYDELSDGDTVPLHQSASDGYSYQRSEMLYFPEIRSTMGLYGLPAASGGLQQAQFYVNQQTGKVSCSEAYYVQSGVYTPTQQGLLSVWSFGQRGRGVRTVGGTPLFSHVPNSSLVQDGPIGQTLLRQLSANVRAPNCEIFVVNSSVAPFWQANTTPVGDGLVQPNYGHEDGCWYEAVEVYGPTGSVEPKWPGYVGGIVIDGGVVWIGVGFGALNGQTLPYPKSNVDAYTYSAADACFYLPYFRHTGAVQAGTDILMGPSASGGATRIQRLQKSIFSRVASSTVTYWNGSSQVVTNDGMLGVLAVCWRSTTAFAPSASAFFEFTGSEFAPGYAPTDANLQSLNGNINFARLRPEGFYSWAKANGDIVSAPTSPVDAYAYQRQELLYPWIIADTGAIAAGKDYALRGIILSVDPALGEVHTRVDYYQGGGPVTTGNGAIDVLTLAFRKAETLLSGVVVIPTQGNPSPAAPGSGNLVPNGDFSLWAGIQQNNQQLVGTPDMWAYTNSTADGYVTQQPGLPGGSAYAMGCDVGNHSAPADTQWVEVGSAFIPIWPGGTYDFKWIAKASPAISQGMFVRLHFRDANNENDTFVTISPVAAGGPLSGALGTSPSTFASHVIMPQDGDSYVQTVAWGALAIQGGPLSYTPAYCWVELGNDEPNISSTVIFGLVWLSCLSLDVLSPANVTGSIMPSASLSQSGTSTTIDVAASTLTLPEQSVGYSAGSVNPGTLGTWYIYADDLTLAGGAVTFEATADPTVLVAAPGRITFGKITTVGGGGASGGGGGTGGGKGIAQ